MEENRLSKTIVDAAFEVHQELGGPGLLEQAYEEPFVWELENEGLQIKRQTSVPINYKGQQLSASLRLDILVNDLVIVECKATTKDTDIYKAQLLTYLRNTDRKLGILFNFGKKYLKNGITRVVNGL